MLAKSEVEKRIAHCRPEVRSKIGDRIGVATEGLFFCTDCRSYFRQKPVRLYQGLPKNCNCARSNARPWVPDEDKKKMEVAVENYKNGLTVSAISAILGVSAEKVYIFIRGVDKCYDQRLRQDSDASHVHSATRSKAGSEHVRI